MTQDEIIRMAQEAGMLNINDRGLYGDFVNLERFAALVAAYEREKAKAVFEELEREVKAEIINAINGAVKLERETCAKLCEEIWAVGYGPSAITAAIRARGEK